MARSRWMKVLLGTSPGLERLMLGSVPALIAGALGAWAFGGWIGLGIGVATLVGIITLSRKIGD